MLKIVKFMFCIFYHNNRKKLGLFLSILTFLSFCKYLF